MAGELAESVEIFRRHSCQDGELRHDQRREVVEHRGTEDSPSGAVEILAAESVLHPVDGSVPATMLRSVLYISDFMF